MKNSVRCKAEHTHEHSSDDEALDTADDAWADPTLYDAFVLWNVVEDAVNDHAVGGSDEEDAEDVEDETN